MTRDKEKDQDQDDEDKEDQDSLMDSLNRIEKLMEKKDLLNKGQDWDQDQEDEEEQDREEALYLEKACQEVQWENNAAQARELTEACQEYRETTQAAILKLEKRLLGRAGIITIPEMPTCPLGSSNLTTPHKWVKAKDEESAGDITDDDEDEGLPQSNRTDDEKEKKRYVQFNADQTHSIYLAAGKDRHLSECVMLSTLKAPTLEPGQDEACIFSGRDQEKAEDTRPKCYAAGKESPMIEFVTERTNLREFLCLIRQAEVAVDLTRMTKDMREATSKRQRKKLEKMIRKKRAKCTASNILSQVLRKKGAG